VQFGLCRLRKIDYPIRYYTRICRWRTLHAVDECGTPVVSIAGGEPLLHKELPEISTESSRGKIRLPVHQHC
jgi:MoaA/NifB/PqqE/SkfB family radical SAM enzyme